MLETCCKPPPEKKNKEAKKTKTKIKTTQISVRQTPFTTRQGNPNFWVTITTFKQG